LGLAIKRSVGRFRLREDLADVLVTEGFALLGIETPHEHVGSLADLPLHHRDPFGPDAQDSAALA